MNLIELILFIFFDIFLQLRSWAEACLLDTKVVPRCHNIMYGISCNGHYSHQVNLGGWGWAPTRLN